MSVIETKAAEVLAGLPPTPPGTAGIIDIGTIVSIIEGLVSLYECLHRRPAAAVAACHNPGITPRFLLRRQIRRRCPTATRAEHDRLFEAILGMAARVTEPDFVAMAEEADGR